MHDRRQSIISVFPENGLTRNREDKFYAVSSIISVLTRKPKIIHNMTTCETEQELEVTCDCIDLNRNVQTVADPATPDITCGCGRSCPVCGLLFCILDDWHSGPHRCSNGHQW